MYKRQISDCAGQIFVTDILLQGGSLATGWVPHPSEIRFTLDLSLIHIFLDRTTSPSFTLKNGGIYFIACIIRPNARTAQYVIGDRSDGKCWVSEAYSFTGELNRFCTADIAVSYTHLDVYKRQSSKPGLIFW